MRLSNERPFVALKTQLWLDVVRGGVCGFEGHQGTSVVSLADLERLRNATIEGSSPFELSINQSTCAFCDLSAEALKLLSLIFIVTSSSASRLQDPSTETRVLSQARNTMLLQQTSDFELPNRASDPKKSTENQDPAAEC